MRHNKAREASTAALNQLADAIRPCDFNGFTPDPAEDGNPEANPKQTDGTLPSTLLNPPEDPAEWRIWMQGYLAACSVVAAQAQARIDAILERRPA